MSDPSDPQSAGPTPGTGRSAAHGAPAAPAAATPVPPQPGPSTANPPRYEPPLAWSQQPAPPAARPTAGPGGPCGPSKCPRRVRPTVTRSPRCARRRCTVASPDHSRGRTRDPNPGRILGAERGRPRVEAPATRRRRRPNRSRPTSGVLQYRYTADPSRRVARVAARGPPRPASSDKPGKSAEAKPPRREKAPSRRANDAASSPFVA